jgi:hypothetical protein
MTTDSKTNEILQQMQDLRKSIAIQHVNIKTEVGNLKQAASKAVDLKHQLFSHPFLASMIAGTLGFFLIPKRNKKPSGDDSELLKNLLAELRGKLHTPDEFDAKSNSQSWATKAFDFMKGYATQMIISQAKKRLVSYLANLARSNRERSPISDKFESNQCENYPLHPQK